MRFAPHNNYCFTQDFIYCGDSIPSDREWTMERWSTDGGGKPIFTISAKGFGGECDYGNGSITVHPRTKFQIARLKAEARRMGIRRSRGI